MNDFQKSFTENRKCAIEIIKLFHPDLQEDKIKKVKVLTKYDWSIITGCGVEIGIEFSHGLMSGNKPMHFFQEAFKNNQFKFWRFYNDVKYHIESKEEYKYLKIMYNIIGNDIFDKYKIKKPSPKQMSDYYHSN